MCFYDQYKYACNDWKWGNFRQHCSKEYRTGETCGMKMIFGTMPLQGHCPQCEKIEKKLRRIAKAKSDYARWSQEPERYKASMEKARADVMVLQHEVEQLQNEKDKRYANVCNSRRQMYVA